MKSIKYYPEFYTETKRALVKEIKDANTWADVVNTTEALIEVGRLAKQMAEEERHHRENFPSSQIDMENN